MKRNVFIWNESILLLAILADFIDTLYAWSAFNTEIIGQYLGYAVLKLFQSSYPLGSIHLIGHSLGISYLYLLNDFRSYKNRFISFH